MAARGADGAAGNEQPRPRQQPLVGGLLQAPIGAAGVPHAGEAAVEHLVHQTGGARRHQRQRYVLHVADHDLGHTTWTWLSIRPGITVRPPQSITLAVASLIGLAEISRIASPSTTSSWPPRNSPAPGSSISKFLKW